MKTIQAPTVLVLDDQVGEVGSLQQRAFLRNYETLPYSFVFESCRQGDAYGADSALDAVARESDVALVLLDLKFGPNDQLLGFEILKRLTAEHAALPVLVLSAAERDVEMLGRCLEDGAVGFVEKHRSPEYLRLAIERAIDLGKHQHVLLGQSPPLKELRRQAARLSPYDQIPVLILGERGTGKERVARYIHQSGPRRQGPFVAVNCGGVPESLFEAEFFGTEKGAYTGAAARRMGYLERAHGGTLFLDEVGTLPLTAQPKLLRVFQERTFYRLGSTGQEIASSFQLLSATNSDPQHLVAEGLMREDFLDRIAAVTIHAPTLRACLQDIPLLARHFLARLVGDRKNLDPTAVRALQAYSWPGNVRELQRVIQDAVVRSEDSQLIEVHHLPAVVLSRRSVELPQSSETTALNVSDWARQRVLSELRIAVEAKRVIRRYKGQYWKAEFMRSVYPHCRAQNAKGFSDLIRHLTKGPWGNPSAATDPELSALLQELEA